MHNADWPWKYLVLWYGGLGEGSNPSGPLKRPGSIAKGTLLFSRLGLTNVREEAGMGGAALGVILAGLVEA